MQHEVSQIRLFVPVSNHTVVCVVCKPYQVLEGIENRRSLFHEHFFFQVPFQESIVDIELSYLSAFINSNGYYNSNCCRLNYQAKCFIEVETSYLLKIFNYKPGLMLMHWTIWMFLHFEDPLAPYGLLLGGRLTKNHVLFFSKARHSSLMADFQCSCWRASQIDIGSFEIE